MKKKAKKKNEGHEKRRKKEAKSKIRNEKILKKEIPHNSINKNPTKKMAAGKEVALFNRLAAARVKNDMSFGAK